MPCLFPLPTLLPRTITHVPVYGHDDPYRLCPRFFYTFLSFSRQRRRCFLTCLTRDTGGQQFAPRTRGPATYLKISICCSTPANQHEWPKKKKNFTYVHTEHVSERPNGVRAYIVRRLQSFIDSIVVGGETINVYI